MRRIRLLIAPLMLLALLLAPGAASAFIGVSVAIAPPVIPVYDQPPCPDPGYLWTPGYWSYGPEGYFWVPGTWVEPPAVGLLWTPGYWGWSGGAYLWNGGYWGPHIGFYGGVNYGFGYGGIGFDGGYWNGGHFFYNRSVTNVSNTHITNVYNRAVASNNASRASFNGGTGGTHATPTAAEREAARDPHTQATSAQTRHREEAGTHHELLASVNHGRPAVAATSRPGELSGRGTVAARDAADRPGEERHADAGTERHEAGSPAAKPGVATPRPVYEGAGFHPPRGTTWPRSAAEAGHSTEAESHHAGPAHDSEAVHAAREPAAARPGAEHASHPGETAGHSPHPAHSGEAAQSHAEPAHPHAGAAEHAAQHAAPGAHAAPQHAAQPHPAPQHEAEQRGHNH